jgi:glucose dehydrogenase
MQPAYKSISTAIALALPLALAGCGQPADQPGSAAAPQAPAAAPAGVAPGDWPLINRDLRANRFSPLTEITAANVATLTSSWTYQLGGNSTAVPIVVAGIMYLPS